MDCAVSTEVLAEFRRVVSEVFITSIISSSPSWLFLEAAVAAAVQLLSSSAAAGAASLEGGESSSSVVGIILLQCFKR